MTAFCLETELNKGPGRPSKARYEILYLPYRASPCLDYDKEVIHIGIASMRWKNTSCLEEMNAKQGKATCNFKTDDRVRSSNKRVGDIKAV